MTELTDTDDHTLTDTDDHTLTDTDDHTLTDTDDHTSEFNIINIGSKYSFICSSLPEADVLDRMPLYTKCSTMKPYGNSEFNNPCDCAYNLRNKHYSLVLR